MSKILSEIVLNNVNLKKNTLSMCACKNRKSERKESGLFCMTQITKMGGF
jgi:hypothetical protein